MINGLSPLANASLVWAVASGYAVDSETGNYVGLSSGVTYYASLRQKRNPQYDYLLGADNTAVYMEGRLTGPLALSGVTPGSSAAATINEEKDALSYCRMNKLLSIIGSSLAHQSEASLDWLVKEAYRTSDA
jgi:hypothetical protein